MNDIGGSIKDCPVCGKKFDVIWPGLWAYKRNDKFYCSWHCLRTLDEKKGGSPLTKVTLADKKKAVQIAIDGGDPREFLGTLCKNPEGMWHAIKRDLKDIDPERYALVPAQLPHRKRETQTPEGEYSSEQTGEDHTAMEEKAAEAAPAESKITEPLNYAGFTVRSIEGKFGRYTRTVNNDEDWIDFRKPDGRRTEPDGPRLEGFSEGTASGRRSIGGEPG